uniref:Putative zinc-binding oxidoreductase n=2 Tax=Ornithodoros turicata TaxID=34597 RepID=A0A2R5LHA4_9ACAR
MKTLYKEIGEGQRLHVVVEEQAPIPRVEDGCILVNVKACALSETEDLILHRVNKANPKRNFPVCCEVAGVVVDVGPTVSSLQPGDEVVGIIPLDYGQSGCSEYVALHEYDVTIKPQGVSFVDAAGCVGDAVRAYTGLHYLGRLSSGDTALILDGASSFGALAVQLAHHWGAKVITTWSTEDERLYLEGLGSQAECLIHLGGNNNYSMGYNNNHEEPSNSLFSACMQESAGLGVDLVVDGGVSEFGDTFGDRFLPSKHDIISCLAVGGRWVTSKRDLQLDPPHSQMLFMKCASVGFLFEQAWTLSSTQQGRYLHILMDIMEKVSSSVIRPNIHHTVAFEAVPEALQRLPQERVGKVVVTWE